MSVDFPDPDGPIKAVYSPFAHIQRQPSEGMNLLIAHLVGLPHILYLNQSWHDPKKRHTHRSFSRACKAVHRIKMNKPLIYVSNVASLLPNPCACVFGNF